MREIAGLVLVIIFVWATMLVGLVIIFTALPFLASTLTARFGRFIESVIVVGVASAMVLAWLAIWKEMAFRQFTRTLTKRTSKDSDQQLQK